MKIAELSRRSGVAVPTIKFYVREGLLASGELTSPNQAAYSDAHIERLKLIRALVDVGGLSIAAVQQVLGAVDDTEMPLDWAFGVAQRALPHRIDASATENDPDARIDGVLSAHGWRVSSDNPGLPMVSHVVGSMTALGHAALVDILPAYADAAEIVATADLEAIGRTEGRQQMIEAVVVGTALGETLFSGLRLIAQEHISNQLFPTERTTEYPCATAGPTGATTDDTTTETES